MIDGTSARYLVVEPDSWQHHQIAGISAIPGCSARYLTSVPVRRKKRLYISSTVARNGNATRSMLKLSGNAASYLVILQAIWK